MNLVLILKLVVVRTDNEINKQIDCIDQQDEEIADAIKITNATKFNEQMNHKSVRFFGRAIMQMLCWSRPN